MDQSPDSFRSDAKSVNCSQGWVSTFRGWRRVRWPNVLDSGQETPSWRWTAHPSGRWPTRRPSKWVSTFIFQTRNIISPGLRNDKSYTHTRAGACFQLILLHATIISRCNVVFYHCVILCFILSDKHKEIFVAQRFRFLYLGVDLYKSDKGWINDRWYRYSYSWNFRLSYRGTIW